MTVDSSVMVHVPWLASPVRVTSSDSGSTMTGPFMDVVHASVLGTAVLPGVVDVVLTSTMGATVVSAHKMWTVTFAESDRSPLEIV